MVYEYHCQRYYTLSKSEVYINVLSISQLRNCHLYNSDYSMTKMCGKLAAAAKKTEGRKDEGKRGKEEDAVFNAGEIALKS